jgi:hypothetical protein
VGLGHVNGIKNNWTKDIDLTEIMKAPVKANRSIQYLKAGVIIGTILVVGIKVWQRKIV